MNDSTRAPTPDPPRMSTRIDALVAPVEDGGLLIDPGVERLVETAHRNRALRHTHEFPLLGRPVGAWSDDMGDASAPPVIMTGHQPEFFHAGVWIKHVFAARLARRIGGTAELLIVDGDVPGVIQIAWPELCGETCEVRSSRASAVMNWRGYEHILDRSVIDYAAMFEPVLDSPLGVNNAVLQSFASAMTGDVPAPERANYVDRFLAGLRATDAVVGVDSTTHVRVSTCFDIDRPAGDLLAAAFVGHAVESAAEFASHYNAALARYRRARGIRGTRHPIPDLAIRADRVELPFWIVHPDRPRARLFVGRPTDKSFTALFAGASIAGKIEIGALRADPRAALASALGEYRIRPRALAQTLYARLFACDLFIHGIGGAKYDQITDDLIRRAFDVEPPGFGTASATARLPLPAFDVSPRALSEARHVARDVRFNPQRYLTAAERERVRSHLEERSAAIAESTLLHNARSKDRAARRRACGKIRAANRAILAASPRPAAEANDRILETEARVAHNAIARSREWFFALHGAGRLAELRDAVHARVDAAT